MKKIIFCLLFITLLLSCDFSLIKKNGDSFKETIIGQNTNSPYIKFLILTDMHLGREEEDKGITDYSDTILSYIDKDEYAFTLLCGDIADTSYQFGKVKNFISKLKDKCGNDNIIYAIGNHELHYSDKNSWINYNFGDKDHNLYHKYVYDDLSIYKLDSADRSLGINQITELEKALSKDKSKFKLFLSHVPISGKNGEMTSLQFTLATAEERNKLILLMKKYNVGVYLTGHHHIGNFEEHYDNTTGQFILAAAHARNFHNLESSGFYYEGILDKNNKVLSIKAYNAKDNTLAHTYYFNLP